ncbi:DUF2071 domain-containing protein [Virgibacillus sp. NKC19-16]|uniref:YqjF family protein n=1 Tax=Virgibacillus salidurans TaxID=2831673 RepID=UPI001F3867AF|nr:DUF2071 domain-containing protein [Virgibacillus sp. NKC19-16]UJL47196.1 DUF2071 domain-containing protein [Virgibacillus sp. NKC19-16]
MYKSIRKSTQHRDYPLPDSPWIMTQKWDHLLFMHLPVSQEVMKAQLTEGLELDTYDGVAWITIIPFKISDMRLRKMPPFPFLRSFLELNVRTYVRRNGRAGIYFFSLDADKLLAVLGARVATLPYFYAKMKMKKRAGSFHYSSVRRGNADAIFKGSYHPISEAYYPEKGSLTHWLLERYYFWSYKDGALFRGDIHHRQWKIRDAEATIQRQNMVPFLPENNMNEEPLLLHYASSRRVLFWPIKKVE